MSAIELPITVAMVAAAARDKAAGLPVTPAMAAWLREHYHGRPITPRLAVWLCVADQVWAMVEEIEASGLSPRNPELQRIYRGLRRITENDPAEVEPGVEIAEAVALIEAGKRSLAVGRPWLAATADSRQLIERRRALVRELVAEWSRDHLDGRVHGRKPFVEQRLRERLVALGLSPIRQHPTQT